jgi:hypothetical protein
MATTPWYEDRRLDSVVPPKPGQLNNEEDQRLRTEIESFYRRVDKHILSDPKNVPHVIQYVKARGKEIVNRDAYKRYGVPMWEDVPYYTPIDWRDVGAWAALGMAAILAILILGAFFIRFLLIVWGYMEVFGGWLMCKANPRCW